MKIVVCITIYPRYLGRFTARYWPQYRQPKPHGGTRLSHPSQCLFDAASITASYCREKDYCIYRNCNVMIRAIMLISSMPGRFTLTNTHNANQSPWRSTYRLCIAPRWVLLRSWQGVWCEGLRWANSENEQCMCCCISCPGTGLQPHWPQYRQPGGHGRGIQAMHRTSLITSSVPADGCCAKGLLHYEL
jgi:hypothetical protein